MKDNKYYSGILKELAEQHPFWNNTDLAHEIILQEILNNEFKPGERLPQDLLANVLDMSRTPIRDACFRLEQEHYVDRNEKNGWQVSEVKLKDYIDFSEFRLCLESRAAYFAARNITNEQLELLKQNLEDFKQAELKGDLYLAMSLDNKFHELIALASKNSYIYETICRFSRRKLFYHHILVQHPSFSYIVNKHTAIYNAIAANNEEEAEKAMHSHMDFYLRNIGNV